MHNDNEMCLQILVVKPEERVPFRIISLSLEFNQRCVIVVLKPVLLLLDRGSIIPSSQQILKCHRHHKYTDRELADILRILDGAPSAAPHSIGLQLLEKKLYLNFLNTVEASTNDLKPSLG
jgi:hypothetical protein